MQGSVAKELRYKAGNYSEMVGCVLEVLSKYFPRMKFISGKAHTCYYYAKDADVILDSMSLRTVVNSMMERNPGIYDSGKVQISENAYLLLHHMVPFVLQEKSRKRKVRCEIGWTKISPNRELEVEPLINIEIAPSTKENREIMDKLVRELDSLLS